MANLTAIESLEQAIDRAPLTVAPDTPVLEVIQQMRVRQPMTTCVLVTQDQYVMGLFTDRNVVDLVATGVHLQGVTIAEVMTRSVITLTLEQARQDLNLFDKLCEYQIHHLPIVDSHSRLRGLVSFDRLCRLLQPDLRQQLQTEISGRRIEQVILQQSEAALQENQRVLWTLMSSLPGIAYRCLNDQDWTIKFASEGCRALTGYDATDLIDNYRVSFRQLIHPDDRATVRNSIDVALAKNESYQLIYRLITAEGVEKWVWEQGCGVLGSEEDTRILEGILFDITDRERARLEQEQTEMALQKSEATNRALLAAIPDLMIRISRDGTYLDFLPANDFKTVMPFADMRGRNLFDVMPLSIAQQRMRYIDQALATGKAQVYEFELLIEGETYYQEARITVSGKDEVLAIVRDISKRKQAEIALQKAKEDLEVRVQERTAELWQINQKLQQEVSERRRIEAALRESEFKLRMIIENSVDAIALKDTEGRYLLINPACASFMGLPIEAVLGFRDEEIFSDQTARMFRDSDRQVMAQRVTLTYEEYTEHQGDRRAFLSTKAPYQSPQGEILGVIGIYRDITEHKQAEATIRQSEARFRRIVESNMIGVFFADEDHQITEANDAFLAIVGYTRSDLCAGTMNWQDITPPEHMAIAQQISEELQMFGVSKTYEKEYIRKDGTCVSVLIGIALMEDEQHSGKDVTFVLDITDRKAVEQQLKASLGEKELLLKEVHHRVKNNLQVISSIFSLQSQYVEDASALSILEECQQRISSMALIHEKLYQSDSFGQVNFSEYICNLASNLFATYNVSRSLVHLNLQVSDIALSLDMAIPCGLLLNELVSNALKHAFPDRQSGEVTIRFSTAAQHNLLLVVQDDGVGLPADFNWQQTNSLGLRLVRALIRQLQGTLKVRNDNITSFEIIFPLPQQRSF